MAGYQGILRRLAIGDEELCRAVLSGSGSGSTGALLDGKASELVRLGALIAFGADTSSYYAAVSAAAAAGASPDEMVGTLIAVAPVVGLVRTVAAAPRLAAALGYDIDEALERLDD